MPITREVLDGMNIVNAERVIHRAWMSGQIGHEEYQNWLNYLIMGTV